MAANGNEIAILIQLIESWQKKSQKNMKMKSAQKCFFFYYFSRFFCFYLRLSLCTVLSKCRVNLFRMINSRFDFQNQLAAREQELK